jgi:hypothetical protein
MASTYHNFRTCAFGSPSVLNVVDAHSATDEGEIMRCHQHPITSTPNGGTYKVVLPGAFSNTSLTGSSSNDRKSNTTFASSKHPSPASHKNRNAGLVDPSVRFRLVTVVVKVPLAYLGVLTVYMTEPASESRMVALKISSSSDKVKERFRFKFIVRGVLGGMWGVMDVRSWDLSD